MLIGHGAQMGIYTEGKYTDLALQLHEGWELTQKVRSDSDLPTGQQGCNIREWKRKY